MLVEEFKNWFASHQEEMFQDLASVIAVNSVGGDPVGDCPFGEGPAEALKRFLQIADRLGFETDNVDNYAGAVHLGTGEESVGILAHLDVVPAGNGWDTDPFCLTIKDGVAYGRGTIDDKGAAIAALYGMMAIRDMGLPLKRRLTLIVGTNEEQGCGCMDYYMKHRSAPTLGFTPDANYPVIYGEKGQFFTRVNFDAESTPILSMTAGEVFNAVPSECMVVLDGKAVSADALQASADKGFAMGYPVTIETAADGTIHMLVKGRAAHGSTPQLGVNSAVSAAEILCDALGEKAGKLVHFIKNVVGRDGQGKTAGVFFEDSVSGSVSFNLGIVRYGAEENWLGIDMRFPVTFKSEKIAGLFDAMAAKEGVTYEVHSCADPHYVPADSELVSTLLSVYRTVTGETDAQAMTIGGGTYARHAGKNFVGFGLEFPGRKPNNMHEPNENFVIADFMEHCVICGNAMYELAKA